MPFGTGAAILAGAGIQGATSLAGGKKGASAATQAAQLQAQAAQQALQLQALTRAQNVGVLQPFVNFGTSALGALGDLMGPLTTSTPTNLAPFTFQPTMADLEGTPGYQFTLQQGLRAAQNSLSSMGLGKSGPAVREATSTATGLAASTWPQVFNAEQSSYQTNTNSMLASRTMYLQQLQQIYNMLTGNVNVGLQGASALAGVNQAATNQMASAVTGIGTAQASGVVGSANALTGALGGVGSAAGGAA